MVLKLPINQIAYSLIYLIFLFSCSKNSDKTTEVSSLEFSEEIAKEVSFVTNGEVHFYDEVQVIFNNPVIEENEIESSPSDVFSFNPSVEGKAVWVSTTVLKFVPDVDLPMREKIEGELNLQKLSQDFSERKQSHLYSFQRPHNFPF